MNHADILHHLHHAERPLFLPNCWDAASAAALHRVGAHAVATSSAGMSWAHGHADGSNLPPEVLVHSVREITRVLECPLSVDVEGGYSDDPAEVAELVGQLIDAGAVGINVEDGRDAPSLLAAKIRAIRQIAEQRGVRLFINARTDVFLKTLVPEEQQLTEALERAAIYRDAGCDGLFVPLVLDAERIGALAAQVPLPLNVLAWPGLPDTEALTRLGVKRISAGSGIAKQALEAAAVAARAFVRGDLTSVTAPLQRVGNPNKLFPTG